MKAKIKRIPVDTMLDADGHYDSFVSGMWDMYKSKEVFEFEPYDGKGVTNWFICTDEQQSFNFHISWLKDIQK